MNALGFLTREKERLREEEKHQNQVAEELRKEEERFRISELIREHNRTHRRVSEGVVDIEGETLARLQAQSQQSQANGEVKVKEEGVQEEEEEAGEVAQAQEETEEVQVDNSVGEQDGEQ